MRFLINYLPRFQFVRFGLDDFQLALLNDIGCTGHMVLDTINERTLNGGLVQRDRGGIRGVGFGPQLDQVKQAIAATE
jgi:hypothetical protein